MLNPRVDVKKISSPVSLSYSFKLMLEIVVSSRRWTIGVAGSYEHVDKSAPSEASGTGTLAITPVPRCPLEHSVVTPRLEAT